VPALRVLIGEGVHDDDTRVLAGGGRGVQDRQGSTLLGDDETLVGNTVARKTKASGLDAIGIASQDEDLVVNLAELGFRDVAGIDARSGLGIEADGRRSR
jgi:hypothetical protein